MVSVKLFILNSGHFLVTPVTFNQRYFIWVDSHIQDYFQDSNIDDTEAVKFSVFPPIIGVFPENIFSDFYQIIELLCQASHSKINLLKGVSSPEILLT